MNFVATEKCQQVAQILALDAFGEGSEFETVGHLNDGAHDRRIVGIGEQIADEGLVDLQLVHGKAFEVSQARITRTEIIDR